jgi:hypothetical protein
VKSVRVERDSVSDRWSGSGPKHPVGRNPDCGEAECAEVLSRQGSKGAPTPVDAIAEQVSPRAVEPVARAARLSTHSQSTAPRGRSPRLCRTGTSPCRTGSFMPQRHSAPRHYGAAPPEDRDRLKAARSHPRCQTSRVEITGEKTHQRTKGEGTAKWQEPSPGAPLGGRPSCS